MDHFFSGRINIDVYNKFRNSNLITLNNDFRYDEIVIEPRYKCSCGFGTNLTAKELNEHFE